ncbi:hypothetical protein B0H14DRAFT_2586620 [Mycena olivaceomarginata]|nr:hypothetical protein B0H14DRAFT_2586620 [Mycena olivaceomarginata]
MERDPSLTEAASKVELSIGEYGSLSFPLHHRIQRLNSYPHSAKTAQLISPEQLNRVLSFDDVSAEIRYEAATCLIGLLNSDRGRATSSMIDTFFTMINASELDEETLTDLVDRMLEDPLIRGFLSKGMAAEKILAKLGIATASTKQVALTLVAAFSKNVEVCASIIRDSRTKKIFEEIGSLLKDSNPDVQDHALKAVFAVSQNQEARESIMSTAEIIKSVIGLLDHRRLSTCILAFDIMDSFLSEGNDLQNLVKVGGFRAICPDFQIPPDDRAELISLFSSPNSAIANRAGDIIKHFAPNPQFRREMLNTDIWAKLLQKDDTADLVVEILAEFAKYYQPEKIKIPHVSGIMAQLLIMTKANVENVDCWQPGLKVFACQAVDVREYGGIKEGQVVAYTARASDAVGLTLRNQMAVDPDYERRAILI